MKRRCLYWDGALVIDDVHRDLNGLSYIGSVNGLTLVRAQYTSSSISDLLPIEIHQSETTQAQWKTRPQNVHQLFRM